MCNTYNEVLPKEIHRARLFGAGLLDVGLRHLSARRNLNGAEQRGGSRVRRLRGGGKEGGHGGLVEKGVFDLRDSL